jgi:hypothetical protein
MIYAISLSAALYWRNRNVDHAAFDRNMAEILVFLSEDKKPVVGPTNAWFDGIDPPPGES